jgi:hypothetical protein
MKKHRTEHLHPYHPQVSSCLMPQPNSSDPVKKFTLETSQLEMYKHKLKKRLNKLNAYSYFT